MPRCPGALERADPSVRWRAAELLGSLEPSAIALHVNEVTYTRGRERKTKRHVRREDVIWDGVLGAPDHLVEHLGPVA